MASESDMPGEVPVSVMIFTLNEEWNLPVCLTSVSWAADVIVIDSFSTDRTRQIAEESGARFYQNEFRGFGSQRNWALENTNPRYEWILILDADERVPKELAREIGDLIISVPESVGAYRVRRRFYMWGRWLRYSSLYPTWVVRFIRNGRVRFIDRGHAETQEVSGELRDLKHDLIDENLKGIDGWFERQNRYSGKDAEHEVEQQSAPLKLADLFSRDPLLRRMAIKRLGWRAPFRPLLYFLYSFILRRGFLDGRDGFAFCYMRAFYQSMIVIKKYDIQRRRQLHH